MRCRLLTLMFLIMASSMPCLSATNLPVESTSEDCRAWLSLIGGLKPVTKIRALQVANVLTKKELEHLPVEGMNVVDLLLKGELTGFEIRGKENIGQFLFSLAEESESLAEHGLFIKEVEKLASIKTAQPSVTPGISDVSSEKIKKLRSSSRKRMGLALGIFGGHMILLMVGTGSGAFTESPLLFEMAKMSSLLVSIWAFFEFARASKESVQADSLEALKGEPEASASTQKRKVSWPSSSEVPMPALGRRLLPSTLVDEVADEVVYFENKVPYSEIKNLPIPGESLDLTGRVKGAAQLKVVFILSSDPDGTPFLFMAANR